MAKSAVLIGATGLVGGHVLDLLLASSCFDRVTAITRRPLSISSEGGTSEKLNNIVVDFEHLEDYAEAFAADCFFSCLGTTKRQAGSIAAQRTVDVDYQLHAAQLAKAAGVSHCVLVSSSGAKAKSPSAYLRMKGELEQQVSALGFAQLSIMQPSLLVGTRERARAGESIAAVLMSGFKRVPGLAKYQPITGEQVARAMVALASKDGAAEGRQYYRLDQLFELA